MRMKCRLVSVVLPFLILAILEMQWGFLKDQLGSPTTHEHPKNITAVTENHDKLLVTSNSLQPSQSEELVQQCMSAAHLDLSLVTQAKTNAKYFFNEFRRVIPQRSLRGYRSHCWKVPYLTRWNKQFYSGHIGDIFFSRKSRRKQIIPALTKKFPTRIYESNLICLPNLFLAGFPKCGTTFLFCFINKLVSSSLYSNSWTTMNVEKEPHFWVLANAGKLNHVPIADEIGIYLLNFLPGLKIISESSRKDGVLMDSTPNNMFNWPRFRESDHDLANYCLMPSVLPTLLPDSKYIVIMRNPIKMLYSAFWFSCTSIGVKFSNELLLKSPSLFHNRIMSKLNMFNDCMRNRSIPSISHACELENYSSCIQQRLHLLDKCTHKITFNLFSPELPGCGRSRVAMGMYYVHISKWLSIVPKERFLFLTLEELVRNPGQVAHNIMDFLDLESNVAVASLTRIINSCVENTQSAVDYKHNSLLQMRNDTRLMLEHFYHPFNSLLASLIGKTNTW